MPRGLRPACWLLSLVIAGLHAFQTRHVVNPDGLSYLDLARAFLALDFERAINPHWGPLYPALLALAFQLTQPSPAWVIPTAHAVNFAIFVAALVAFDFSLQELLRARQNSDSNEKSAVTDAGLTLFAYAVFIYSAVALVGLDLISPDLCVLVTVFAAAGLILAMIRRGPTGTRALLLGLVLGLGYYSKAVMFVLSLVLVVSLPLAPALRFRAVRYGAIVAGTFGVLAALLILPISRETGDITFGTSGKLAYAFVVNQVPYTNWQGDSLSNGPTPLHPPRRLASRPEIFEFTARPVGTYPPWFDPTYWTAGLRTQLRLMDQLNALSRSGGFYVNLFLGGAGVTATILLVLIWLGRDEVDVRRHLRQQLPIIALAVAGLAIYMPIHAYGRFIGSFAALLWILPVAAARRVAGRGALRWPDRAALACAACLITPVALHVAADAWESRHDNDPHPRVAAFLHGLGLRPGDRVANIGIRQGENLGSSFEAFWAYLAQLQIVAEIPNGRDFLCTGEPETTRAYELLAQAGARAAVTMAMPSRWCAAGWHRVPETGYYVRVLQATRPE
jgi:hypothetical protein